jgi:hypothetical protein
MTWADFVNKSWSVEVNQTSGWEVMGKTHPEAGRCNFLVVVVVFPHDLKLTVRVKFGFLTQCR